MVKVIMMMHDDDYHNDDDRNDSSITVRQLCILWSFFPNLTNTLQGAMFYDKYSRYILLI